MVDPDAPAITAWQLRGRAYVEAAHASGDQQFTVHEPYPVTLSPGRLLD